MLEPVVHHGLPRRREGEGAVGVRGRERLVGRADGLRERAEGRRRRAVAELAQDGRDAAVVVTLGANDAAEGGVPRDEFRQNLDAICGALKELLPSAAVLLATPPPINPQARLPLPPAKAWWSPSVRSGR